MNEKDIEKRDEKLPPCVAQCAPEFENEIKTLMKLPCKFLRVLGICYADALCETVHVSCPMNYYRVKSMSFRPTERRKT